jgi:hypothetical protein
MCRMRQGDMGRRYAATGSSHRKQSDARGGVCSGDADSWPSQTVCCRETRVERERLVGIDDEPALGVAGGNLRRQASTLATGTTEKVLFERSPVTMRESSKKYHCPRGIGNDAGLSSALAVRMGSEVGMPAPMGMCTGAGVMKNRKWQRSRGGSAGGRRCLLERPTAKVAARTSTICFRHTEGDASGICEV